MTGYDFAPSLERATPSDYHGLFRASFDDNPKLTPDYIDWLYCKNPSGSVVGTDAFFDGKLVAHYATIPRNYRRGERRFRAVLSVNTATHPEHQKRGLFKALATETYAAATRAGFDFVVGVANAQSTHGFLKNLNFRLLGNVRLAVLAKPAPPSPDSLSVQLDAEWLKWRLSNPTASYFATRSGPNLVVKTIARSIPFVIGVVPGDLLKDPDVLPIRPFSALIPSLTPLFPHASSVLLPYRMQPSPWNLICLPLGTATDDRDLDHLAVNGLAMDTY